MKTIISFLALPGLAFTLLLAGCASKPATSGEVAVQAPPSETPIARALAPDVVTLAESVPPATFPGEGWESLFDGASLGNWQEVDFAGRGEVTVRAGAIVLGMGSPFTGIRWTNAFPKVDYEIAFDAMRTMGSDFFCGLTVPVKETHCSLIVGGWGGGLVGISSIDGYDASENETTQFESFERGIWYRIRLRVTTERIEGWIGEEKLVSIETTDRRISVRPGDIEYCIPLGMAAWETGAAFREIRWRRVTGPDGPLK